MKKHEMSRKWRIIWSVTAIFCIAVTVIAAVAGVALCIHIRRSFSFELDLTLFEASARGGTTKLYYCDENGDAIEMTSERLEGGSCIYADHDELPQQLIDAFVAIEDKRFWRHSGIDMRRTAHAALNYLTRGSMRFGGSTITQQLIKNITGERDNTIERKLQEMIWARYLEGCMTKQQIIELYLNIINLSRGCIGVQAAANTYFSKDVSELTLAECATIAAITNNPSYYDPISHPENNIARRDLILDQMLEQGYIDSVAHAAAIAEPLTLDTSIRNEVQNVNSWYTDMVIEDVIADLCEQYDYTPQSASVLIYSGALRIYTAVDIEMQALLDEYFEAAEGLPRGTDENSFQAAMVIIDPTNGDILAVAGAIGEKSGDRVQNYATQTRRPSGSVIKPLSVYAPALEYGLITTGSVYDDVPLVFNASSSGYTPWPRNSPNVYRGLTNVMTAVRDSVNTVTVRILEELGVDRSFDFLRDKVGLKSLISSQTQSDGSVITDRGLAALALGQQNYGVTVREMTAAYTALANGGIYSEPRSYYRVTDSRGNVLLSREDERQQQALSAATAALTTVMLQNVVSSGTASAITLDRRIDVAGKTGTTQDNCDKWFIGYTPYLLGGVWCGYEYPKSMNGISGNPCLEIWDEIMTALHEKYLASSSAETEFRTPSGIVSCRVCADSGKLLTEACRNDARGSRAVTCYYASGTQPTSFCDCHIMVDYDLIGGGVATEDCPGGGLARVGMIQVKRSFPMPLYVTDAQYVWRRLPSGVQPSREENEAFFAPMLEDGTWCGISRGKVQYNRGCIQHGWLE